MLLSFEVSNFRSFRDRAQLSLEAVSAYKERSSNHVSTPRHELLKAAAIYGPNAGGKTNLVRAAEEALTIINTSAVLPENIPLPLVPFLLDTATEQAPSRFEFVLVKDTLQYRYGFEADSQEIHSEWLFVTDYSKKKAHEHPVFLREKGSIDVRGDIADADALVSRTSAKALFLSVASQWNDPLAKTLTKEFSDIRVLSGLHDLQYQSFSAQRSEKILNLCQKADFGIENIRIERNEVEPKHLRMAQLARIMVGLFPNAPKLNWIEEKIFLVHKKYSDGKPVGTVPFDLETDASEGTRKLFRVMGPVLDALDLGCVVFVDELEAKLHPLLTRAIVQLFLSEKTNPKNAQLVFCTHDTNLLTHADLRRDQVWFIEKDEQGASHLYPLSDFKGLRQDTPIERDYINGRFGAIPFLGGCVALEQIGNTN